LASWPPVLPLPVTAAAGSADGDVRLWDVPARRCLRRLVGHTGQIKGIGVTPDGEACVTCSTDCTVKLWKVG